MLCSKSACIYQVTTFCKVRHKLHFFSCWLWAGKMEHYVKLYKELWDDMYGQKQPLEVLCKKSVFKNFTKFTGKHPCQSLLFNKVVGLRCFSVNFANFLRASFFIEHLWGLHSVQLHPPSAGAGVQIFEKGGGAWQDLNFERGLPMTEGGDFFQGGTVFS